MSCIIRSSLRCCLLPSFDVETKLYVLRQSFEELPQLVVSLTAFDTLRQLVRQVLGLVVEVVIVFQPRLQLELLNIKMLRYSKNALEELV